MKLTKEELKELNEKVNRFTEKLKQIPEILAVFYTGSTATKKWTKYSDIDVDIVVKDEDYNKIVKKLPEFLAMWSDEKVKLLGHYTGCEETYAFIGKNYEKVEIDPIKLSYLKEALNYEKNLRIGFDKMEKLHSLIKNSKKVKVDINEKEFNHVLLDTRSNFIYIVRHFAKGQKLSAASEFGGIGGDLFHLLASLKGLKDYELLRQAEEKLTKTEWKLLKSSCKGIKKGHIKNAIKQYWRYMKYIENQYEKVSGKKLNLNCDDKEILEVINKTLEESR